MDLAKYALTVVVVKGRSVRMKQICEVLIV
jgi:hypothetical protein